MGTDYRVLVTGSRSWPSPDLVYKELSRVLCQVWTAKAGGSLVVIHGACPTGADQHASEWCAFPHALVVPVIEEAHPADWKNHGKAAGFMRNSVMVGLGADECLAFILNESRGATHTAERAESAGIPTRRFVL